MQLYDEAISDINRFVTEKASHGSVRQLDIETPVSWPRAGRNNIILKADTGLELGGPVSESLSFLVWTNDRSLVSDRSIRLMGADLPELTRINQPFGKVMIVAGQDFGPENAHKRFREMDLLRLDLSLKGYMIRAVSQEMKEWSRIGTEALDNGFSFSTLGSALIDKYRELDYVTAAEVLFITSSAEDICQLRPTGKRVQEYVNAMRKMVEELSYDCANCEFQKLCKEVDDLRQLKKSLTKTN